MKKQERSPRLEELIPDAKRREEILRRLYSGDDLIGKQGIFTDLLQSMINAALEGEMDVHLAEEALSGKKNRRNGKLPKQVRSKAGPLSINTPRDRAGEFSPKIVGHWERDLNTGIDDAVIHLYAKGNSVDDIKYQLEQLYGVELSRSAISMITSRVMSTAIEWQQRTLFPCYPIVYLDAIHFKVRDGGVVKSKAVYTAYGVGVEGQRDVLGLYIGESEGSRQWGLILEDLNNRGVKDVFFFCIDGLTGFKEVIEAVYPQAQVQRCIVHMIRNSTRFVSYKDRRAVTSDLRKIYGAANRSQAESALVSFASKWDKKYSEISKKWEDNWEELMTFMDWKTDLRRMIYTTNPVEALHRVMRKTTKTKGAWVNEDALFKQLYLCLMHNEKSWKRIAYHWTAVKKDLYEQFGERYEIHLRQ